MSQGIGRYERLQITSIEIINKCDSLDFQVNDKHVVNYTKVRNGITW